MTAVPASSTAVSTVITVPQSSSTPATTTADATITATAQPPASTFTFGQYHDDWVESKTIYQLMSSSECMCCGFSVSALNLTDLMAACSDLEQSTANDSDKTDTKRSSTANNHNNHNNSAEGVWPIFVSERVWTDRVTLRQRLKQRTEWFKTLWNTHSTALTQFWSKVLTPPQQHSLCRVTVQSLHRSFSGEYGMGEAYTVVLIAVTEQIEHFSQTGYDADGCTDAERQFEHALQCTPSDEQPSTASFECSQEWCAASDSVFARLMEIAVTPTLQLLPKRPKIAKPKTRIIPYIPPPVNTTAAAITVAAAPTATITATAPSAVPPLPPPPSSQPTKQKSGDKSGFRSDRRLIRLIIYRKIIEQIHSAFLRHSTSNNNNAQQTATSSTTAVSAEVVSKK